MACECERLFDVVADVARYPEFVPGWQEVRLLQQDERGLLVEQRLGLAGAGQWFRSLAVLKRPDSIVVRPVDAGADGLVLEWQFQRLEPAGCAVRLEVRGQSSSRILALALDVAARQVGGKLLDLFAARAAAVDHVPRKPQPRP